MDEAISEFLNEKIETQLKTNMSEDKVKEIYHKFSLDVWLPIAAKRADQLAVVSHNGKLTHTGVKKCSAIFVTGTKKNDGYIRTGNIQVDPDIIGNSAALDVYKFLSLKLSDGKSILRHLELETDEIKNQFDIPTASYDEISNGLLAIKKSNEDAETSDRLKQVYFPVDNENYHLLSLLTPSGIVYKLKEKIINLKFSEEVKKAKEDKKNNKHNKNGYSDIYDLTVIGFGGTKPQNAGNLSNQNGGRAYLLRSMPPKFSKRSINPPRKSFFKDYINFNNFREDFNSLYGLLVISPLNNINLRIKRDDVFLDIINKIIILSAEIRLLDSGWSKSDYYTSLPQEEKIWLDQCYENSKEDNEEYFKYVKKQLCDWIIRQYKGLRGNEDLIIPDDDLKHLDKIINDCKEGLR